MQQRHFGRDIALDGDTALIGARFDSDQGLAAGAAYFFERQGEIWQQVQKTLPRPPLPTFRGAVASFFGDRLALDGDRAVISAVAGTGPDMTVRDAGEVYFLHKQSGQWPRVGLRREASDLSELAGFGTAVAISGDWAMIGSQDDDACSGEEAGPDCNAGAVYVFQRMGDFWEQVDKLIAPGVGFGDHFGSAIAMSGSLAAIGAYGDDDGCTQALTDPRLCNTGAVYIYELVGGDWRMTDKLIPSDAAAGGIFGVAVAVDGHRVLAGARRSVNNRDGVAYLFELKAPHVTRRGTVNAASFMAESLAPGMIATAFVRNASEQDQAATTTPLPTSLAGTSLDITDSRGVTRPCGLFGIFTNGKQINFRIDPDTALGEATITLRRADGKTSSAVIRIERVAPGVFFALNAAKQNVALATFQRISGGVSTIELTFNPTDLSLVPIDLGAPGDQVFISLFVTGVRLASGPENMSAAIDGQAVPVFSFADELSQFVGLGQVNLGPIPRSFVGTGAVGIVLVVDGKAANPVAVAFR